jgi:hypothetical protein
MRRRCRNASHQEYHNYGGRGITVCEEWSDFTTFRDWARANGYRDDLTIDRIDNDGPYSPENCRWATHIQQVRNTRRNRWVTAWGETKCLAEWVEDDRCLATKQALFYRLTVGWTPEKALTTKSLRPA